MPATRVLVIEDDPTTREVLRRYLTRAGLEVSEADNGAGGLDAFTHGAPDLVILDLMLPGIDGLDVCERIRRTSAVPIMILTALGSESDRVVGLEQGADDYVVKPFSPREVTLRAQRLLQRSAPRLAQAAALVDGDLSIDLTARRATVVGPGDRHDRPRVRPARLPRRPSRTRPSAGRSCSPRSGTGTSAMTPP